MNDNTPPTTNNDQIKTDDQSHEEIITEQLNNDARFEILALLYIHNELSLTELSDYLGKAKSTIHYHLQELLTRKLVEESRKKKVTGSIRAKYYVLQDDAVISMLEDWDDQGKLNEIKKISKTKQAIETVEGEDVIDLLGDIDSLESLSDRNRELAMLQLFSDATRTRIIMNLLINGKLSLTELSTVMGKSKATISRNIKGMKRIKAIYVEQRGREHVYVLSKDFTSILRPVRLQTLQDIDASEELTVFSQTLKVAKSVISLMQYILELTVEFNDRLLVTMNKEHNPEIFKKLMLQEDALRSRIQFLTQEEYKFFMEEYQALTEKMVDLVADRKAGTEQTRPFLVFMIALQMKRIMNPEW